MDQTVIINSFLNVFIWLLPLAALITFLKTPVSKGFIGELLIHITSSLFLDKKKYHIIRNVTLPTDGGSTQIDHIIFSRYGIFVVETKNMKGWIFGGERQKTWTQVIYKKKTKFQNPLHQNYKHVKTLENILDLPPDKFYSVVVFAGDCTFKTPMPGNVTYPRGYLRFVNSKLERKLEPGQVADAITRIKSGRLERSFKTHAVHARHVKEIVRRKKEVKQCPKCGKSMVVRTARRGPNAGKQFWGCTGFPGCRGTLGFDGSGIGCFGDSDPQQLHRNKKVLWGWKMVGVYFAG